MKLPQSSRLYLIAVVATLAAWSANHSVRANGPRVPLLAALAEPTFAPGPPAATLRLSGSFTQGDEVTVGGLPVSTTFISVTELQAELPAELLAVPTTHQIRVRNGSGASGPLDLAVSAPRQGIVVNRAPLSVATVPSALAVADLNGDRRPDLAYFGDNSLEIALADRVGGFGPPASHPLPSFGTHVIAVDLDGDGITDLLAKQGGAGIISVFRNDGTGVFTPGPTLATGHSDDPSTTVGDIDGNGTVDILSANETESTIDVHLGADVGTFVGVPAFATISQPIAPVLHDVDDDGTLDLIVLSPATGALALHRGNGNGTFAAPSNIPVAAGTSTMLFPADVDSDAMLDLLLPGRTPSMAPRLQVLLGQGGGTFAPPPAAVQPLTPSLESLAVTDVDGDGALDVVGVWGGPSAYVLRGDRSGNFALFSQLQLPFSSQRIAHGDLDLDGMPDLIVAGTDPSVSPPQPTLLRLLQQDPGPPPRLVLPDATFTENNSASTSVTMPVLLVDAAGQPATSSAPITITLDFFDGTAIVNSDYRPSPAPSFSIPEGVSAGQIDFRIVGGTQFEQTETFTVQIASATGATIQDGTATVTIVDNDPPPPMADLSTAFAIADPVLPNQPVIGTLTVTNHGPDAANTPSGAIQIGAFDLVKLSNVQITNTNFQVPGVNGGLIRGQSVTPLAPGDDRFLTFSATPTAAANTPQDFYFTGTDPTRLFQLNYAFNQPAAPGRTGVAFAGENDGRVNDLVLNDPEPNVLHIVRNGDSPIRVTHILGLEAVFPGYTQAAMEVCTLGAAGRSLVLVLVREPGVAGAASVLARLDIPTDPNVAVAPGFADIDRQPDRVIRESKCADMDGDGDEDVVELVAHDDESNSSVIVRRNDGGAFTITSESPAHVSQPGRMAIADFDRDGDLDVYLNGLDDSLDPAIARLDGNGVGGLQPGRTTTNMFGLHVADMVGGLAQDPVTNVPRFIDFNGDGFPDLALACTRCADGGTYGIVPLLNLGAASPGDFRVQDPIAIGIAGRTFGKIAMLGVPLGNELLISLTAKDGFNAVLENTTPPNADVVALRLKRQIDERTRRLAGSGPSDIVVMNAFDDAEVDFLALGLRGRLVFDVSGTSQTLDPDGANNVESRTVGIRPGPPDSFGLTAGAIWTPNMVGQLENLAVDPAINSLNGARVYAQDQQGNTADALVLTSSDREVTFVWPQILQAFRLPGAQVQLFAETAGGTGFSASPPVIDDEEPELPVVTIQDATIAETGVATEVVFTVSLSASSTTPVTVAYATADGGDPLTAANGIDDYQSTVGLLTFSPGDTSKEIRVLVLNDVLDEFDEAFFVNLTTAAGATIADGQAIGTIVDDDAPPQLRFAILSAPEGDAGSTTVVVTATLVGPTGAPGEGQPTTSGKTVTLDVSASDVTASSGQDYSFLPKMFILAPGESSTVIAVDVHGDTTTEPDESFHFDIVAINVTTPSAVTFLIEDDDDPPVVSIIPDTDVAENHMTPSGPEVITRLVLSRPSDTPVQVRVRTADVTALGTFDYVELDRLIEIPAGQTSVEVSTFLMNDTLDEPDETYVINLSGAVGATIGDGQVEVRVIDDDDPPVVSIEDVTVREDNLIPTSHGFKVKVTLSKPSSAPVTVAVTPADGNARGGSDYLTAIPGVTFQPGETVRETTVLLIDDDLVEGNETFFLNLSDPVGATIGDGQGLVTIVDDDEPSDREPPSITPPADITAPAASAAGAAVFYPPPAVSDNQPGVSAACVPPSGSVFPIGTTTVTCTATDAAGNTAQSTFDVTVDIGQPRIATRVLGQGVTAPGSGVHYFDVELRNTGTGHARSVQITGLPVRAIGGVGAVTVNALTGPPAALGDLDAGAVAVHRIYVNVPSAVTRVSLTVTGTMTNATGAPALAYSASSAAMITMR
jgi:hypothetical protein